MMLAASSSSFSQTKFTVLELKSKYVLHPNANLTLTTSVNHKLRESQLESQNAKINFVVTRYLKIYFLR